MMKHLKYCLFFLMLLSTWHSYGQKRVLGNPKAFVNPSDPFVQNNYETFISAESTQDKLKNKAWWVVVDRDGAKAYDKPDGNIQSTLKFGSAYYVTDEANDWVELVDALVDKLEIKKIKAQIGWVRKMDLLLWHEGLINPRTKVHQKAFLVNKFDDFKDIPCNQKELVTVFTSPTSLNLKENLSLYKFYFVFKKEGTRYLLGETSMLSIYEPAFLLGWVDKGRIIEWNTRVALEPNNTQEAYNERKRNPAFQVYGFNDVDKAEAFKAGQIGADQADWTRDPVRPNQEVDPSDPKRFPGNFMRFPLLSDGNDSSKVLPYFKSGVFDNVTLNVKCQGNKTVSVQQVGTNHDTKSEKVLVGSGERNNISDSFNLGKYELFKPMYFCRQPNAATYSTFSYVLFWPQRDLRRYHALLQRFLSKVDNISIDQKRIALQEVYCMLLDEFGGGENGKACAEYNIKEIVELILGVKCKRFESNSVCINDKSLKCLMSEKCTSNEELEQIIRCFANSEKTLRKKLMRGENDDFVFSRGAEYFFWIKLTDLF